MMAESKEDLLVKIKLWQKELEEKGLRVNMGKTKVMKCEFASGKNTRKKKTVSDKWPCDVCDVRVGFELNCGMCEKWVHNRCSGVKGKLSAVVGFCCSR